MNHILKYFSELTELQLKQFAALENLYKEWNEKINVISRKDIENLYLNHVLHSLSIAAVFDFSEGTTVIDIGTGGGFPGFRWQYIFPRSIFSLLTALGKN
jgi:16S rRNA (guanine527-N7)-methyltransferase